MIACLSRDLLFAVPPAAQPVASSKTDDVTRLSVLLENVTISANSAFGAQIRLVDMVGGYLDLEEYSRVAAAAFSVLAPDVQDPAAKVEKAIERRHKDVHALNFIANAICRNPPLTPEQDKLLAKVHHFEHFNLALQNAISMDIWRAQQANDEAKANGKEPVAIDAVSIYDANGRLLQPAMQTRCRWSTLQRGEDSHA